MSRRSKFAVSDDGGMKNLTVINNESIVFHFHEAEALPFGIGIGNKSLSSPRYSGSGWASKPGYPPVGRIQCLPGSRAAARTASGSAKKSSIRRMRCSFDSPISMTLARSTDSALTEKRFMAVLSRSVLNGEAVYYRLLSLWNLSKFGTKRHKYSAFFNQPWRSAKIKNF